MKSAFFLPAFAGNVIDIGSRKIVGQLKDEYGRSMYSEKCLDMIFTNGKLTKVASQFGNGTILPDATTELPKNWREIPTRCRLSIEEPSPRPSPGVPGEGEKR